MTLYIQKVKQESQHLKRAMRVCKRKSRIRSWSASRSRLIRLQDRYWRFETTKFLSGLTRVCVAEKSVLEVSDRSNATDPARWDWLSQHPPQRFARALRKTPQRKQPPRRYSSPFEFPARNIITTRSRILETFIRRRSRRGPACIASNARARDDAERRRAYNRETYETHSFGKLQAVSSAVTYESVRQQRERGGGDAGVSELYGSWAFANDFRDKFSARLYEQPRDFRARGTKTRLHRAGLFERAHRLFSMHVHACMRVYMHTYVWLLAQFIRDKSEARNRTRYRGRFGSAAEKIWVLASEKEREDRRREFANVDSGSLRLSSHLRGLISIEIWRNICVCMCVCIMRSRLAFTRLSTLNWRNPRSSKCTLVFHLDVT